MQQQGKRRPNLSVVQRAPGLGGCQAGLSPFLGPGLTPGKEKVIDIAQFLGKNGPDEERTPYQTGGKPFLTGLAINLVGGEIVLLGFVTLGLHLHVVGLGGAALVFEFTGGMTNGFAVHVNGGPGGIGVKGGFLGATGGKNEQQQW